MFGLENLQGLIQNPNLLTLSRCAGLGVLNVYGPVWYPP
jgi:hypothetical protein